MTQEEIAVFKQSILDAIENYVNIKLSDLPTMKSDIAVVLGNGTKEGNKLKIRNAEYDNILSVGNIVFPENSIVYTLAPNGQYNQLFILGQLSDTPANIVGGTIDIGDGAFTVDENGNVQITDGTIDIGDGAFVVDSDGSVEATDLTITGGNISLNEGRFIITNDGRLLIYDNNGVQQISFSSDGVIVGNGDPSSLVVQDGQVGAECFKAVVPSNSTGGWSTTCPFSIWGGYYNESIITETVPEHLLNIYGHKSEGLGQETWYRAQTITLETENNYPIMFYEPVYCGQGLQVWGDNNRRVSFNGNTAFNNLSFNTLGTTTFNNVVLMEDVGGTTFTCNKPTYFNNTVYDANGGTVFVSDQNAKRDIETLDLKESADFIMAQNPVKYRFNEELSNSNRYHHGFIAQEVKETMGENDWGVYIDQTVKDEDNDDTNYTKGLRYNEFIADLVATCQYQQKEIEQQQTKIDDLQSQINELKSLIQNQNKNEE